MTDLEKKAELRKILYSFKDGINCFSLGLKTVMLYGNLGIKIIQDSFETALSMASSEGLDAALSYCNKFNYWD